MEAQIREGTSGAAKLAGRSLGEIEKVPLGQKSLLTINLEEPLTFQDHTSNIDLGIDMQRHTLPRIEPQEVAVQIWAL
jgi:hypothetical protein